MGFIIEAIGLAENHNLKCTSIELAKNAGKKCLSSSCAEKNDIGLVLYISPYRDHYFAEPAFSAFVQRDLEINHDKEGCTGPKTLSIDLLNGSMGFLQGCQVIGAMINAGRIGKGLVVSSDKIDFPMYNGEPKPCLKEQGAALLLSKSAAETGFNNFFYQNISQPGSYESHIIFKDGKFSLSFKQSPSIIKIYIDAISGTVQEYLKNNGTDLSAFDFIIPPQISQEFVSSFADALKLEQDKVVDVTHKEGDLYNASLPVAMDHIIKNGSVEPGKKALIVSVGAGIQVGCAVYNF